MSDRDEILALHHEFDSLFEARRYGEALAVARTAVEVAKRRHGDQSVFASTSLKLASLAHRALGELATAEDLLEASIDIDRVRLGEHHWYFGEALFQLARLHREMRKMADARQEYLRGLHVLSHADSGSGKVLADRHREAGEFLFHASDHATAAEVFASGVDIAEAAFGPDHLFTAMLLNNLGLCEKLMYAFDSAEMHYRRALRIRRIHVGDEHPLVAESLRNLALLEQELSEYGLAEEYLTEALAILRLHRDPEDLEIAQATQDLGFLKYLRGDLLGAHALLTKALDVERSRLGDRDPVVARGMGHLGSLYVETGQLEDAEHLFASALDVQRELFGERHPEATTSRNNLARVYQLKGDYAEAERLYKQVLATRRSTLVASDPQITTSLLNLASLYHDMGSHEAAYVPLQEALTRARETSGEDSLQVALCLNNLAEIHRSAGRYREAQEMCRRVLQIRRARLGEDHPLVAASLNNLALTADQEEAEAIHREVLRVQRRLFGDRHDSVALAYNNLAVCQWSVSRNAEAKGNAQRALEISREIHGGTHPNVSRDLHNLALVLAATQREREALDYLDEATRIDDALILQVVSIASERQRMDLLQQLWMSYSTLLSLVLHTFPDDPAAVATAFELVMRRKTLGAEVLSVQRQSRGEGFRAAEGELALVRGLIAKAMLDEAPAAEDHELEVLIARRDELEAQVARTVSAAQYRKRLDQADCQAIAAALPPGSGLVEYVRIAAPDLSAGFTGPASDRYLAFVLVAGDPGSLRLVDVGADADELDETVAAYREAVTGGNRDVGLSSADERPDRLETVRHAGAELRQLVIDSVLPALRGCRRIFLAPDAALTCVPFEALPTNSGGFVIDDYVISYLTTGRDLLGSGAQGNETATPIVAADPDFDLGGQAATPASSRSRHSREVTRQGTFRPLTGARREGEAIAALLGVAAWLGPDVLKLRLRGQRSPWILHLATHGVFLPDQAVEPAKGPFSRATAGRLDHLARLENPLLRSFLALAGANTWLRGEAPPEEAEDGMLNAEDVVSMDLAGTELVVLSACETGLGRVRVGEGVFGLRRAFVLAGAKTLVMSLWKVPDEETRRLMETFYRALLDGRSRADALRQAQLAIRRDYPDDPLRWGGFICQGEPGPMRVKRSP